MHTDAAIPGTHDSPFVLKIEDVETLQQSDGFAVLQEHLCVHYAYSLCCQHERYDLANWLLVRDVLHALLVPIVELFERACSVATYTTQVKTLDELEYAFTSQARDAFVFLQCFLSSEKERDWCHTRGCPACIVEQSLDSPFSIRLLYAAINLSDVHYPFTLEGPRLPSFMWFLDYVRSAVVRDPLYGEDFFDLLQPKAEQIAHGIEELMRQCLGLNEVLVSESLTPSDPASPDTSVPASPVLVPLGGASKGMRVKRSKMAKRQMKLKMEEDRWMDEMLQKCTQSLDAVLKLKPEPTMTVCELTPDD